MCLFDFGARQFRICRESKDYGTKLKGRGFRRSEKRRSEELKTLVKNLNDEDSARKPLSFLGGIWEVIRNLSSHCGYQI
jgi:hypothetical protein